MAIRSIVMPSAPGKTIDSSSTHIVESRLRASCTGSDVIMASPVSASMKSPPKDQAGHIVTNAHVVDEAEEIAAECIEGGIYRARLVGLDLASDIAVIKVDAQIIGGSRSSSGVGFAIPANLTRRVAEIPIELGSR
ncbi:MAG: trypsin-like peptidase domain-containing protein [Chloroflexi bacterium]|nr:trypsin-like peptidase domain-containing protein [Chloroflexota bacterium]